MKAKINGAFAGIFLSFLVACASVSPEQAATDVKEAKAWYCGSGMLGIRAVARFLISITTGVAVPNTCKAIDAIIEADE